MKRSRIGLIVAGLFATQIANADVRITEFMFEGTGLPTVEKKANGTNNFKTIDEKREFFEITNLGSLAEDINGWTYDDDKAGDAHSFGSLFGSLAPGESLIFTEMTADEFRAHWGLSANTKIYSIGGLSNMGKADTLNIFNSLGALVDSVSYDTLFTPAAGISFNKPVNISGLNPSANTWSQSTPGDIYASHFSANVSLKNYNVLGVNGELSPMTETIARHDFANPGSYYLATVPLPQSFGMMMVGIGLLRLKRRK